MRGTNKWLNITAIAEALISKGVCLKSLPLAYCICGCDQVSFLYSIGKITGWNTFLDYPVSIQYSLIIISLGMWYKMPDKIMISHMGNLFYITGNYSVNSSIGALKHWSWQPNSRGLQESREVYLSPVPRSKCRYTGQNPRENPSLFQQTGR